MLFFLLSKYVYEKRINCDNVIDFHKFILIDEKLFVTRRDKLSDCFKSIKIVIILFGTYVLVFVKIYLF